MTPRPSPERGAVIVEFAFLLPFLAVMVFGIMEFGFVLQDRMTVQSAARSGVRVGSAAGTSVDADKTVLLGIGSAVRDIGLDNVHSVVVYKSTASNGGVPTACANPPQSVNGICNAYTGAQLQQVLGGSAPAAWFGCGLSSLDRSWCPTSRQTIQSNGPDYLGVWVRASRPMLTGFFGSTITITDRGVMRLEPRGI